MESSTRHGKAPLKLRGALTMLFLLVPTIAIGLVATFAVVSYRKGQRDALVEEARTILSLLVQHHPTTPGGSVESPERIGMWVARIAELPIRQPRIEYAMLVNAAGRDLTGGRLPVVRPPLQPGEAVVEPGLYSFLGDKPVANISVRLNEVPGAAIQIGLAAGPNWVHFGHLYDIGAILLITLCLNIWMIRLGLHRLIVPLENVARESHALATGREAHPVRVEGPQEARYVATAFNSMLRRREEDSSRIERTLSQLRDERAASEFERRRFTAMVKTLHEGLVYLSPDGCVAYANPEAERLLDRSAEELDSADVPQDDSGDERAAAERVVVSLIGDEAWQTVRRRFHLNLALVMVRTDEGKPYGYMLLMRDRTEEHRLQRLMAEQDTIASVGMLAAGIAHEINNPLDGLQNCLRRIVRDPQNTAQIDRYAGLMTASLHHIETVVRQLLNLSHKRDRSVRKIDLDEIIRSAVDMARAGQRWSEIELEWQLAADLPHVLADPQNISQVILNLVLNAIDAMPDGGTLVITSRAEASPGERGTASKVVIEICDSGKGMDKELLSKVFEPFFTTKSHERGTGLGLSVSRNLVVEHGGEIEIESEPGIGTTVRFWLPRFFAAYTAPIGAEERGS